MQNADRFITQCTSNLILDAYMRSRQVTTAESCKYLITDRSSQQNLVITKSIFTIASTKLNENHIRTFYTYIPEMLLSNFVAP